MNEAIRRRSLLLLACIAIIAGNVFPAKAASAPNIVLIISDDHAWTDYSFMGHPTIRTPNLDRLARESLTFRRGYVPSSLCCPSLASILTGRYPHDHRVTSNDPPLPASSKVAPGQASRDPQFLAQRKILQGFIEKVPTLTRLLAEKGYLSFQAGKWWQGHFSQGGFTHGMTTGDPSKGGRHGDEGLKIGRQTMEPIFDFIQGAVSEKKPFLVWYAPMLPHDPHNPPERLLSKYRGLTNSIHVARYWAMVEWFDETCGQLLNHLDQKNLTRDTVVIYVTDNGWIQDPQTNRYAPRSKQSPYDGGLRTPILLRWPGKIQPADSPHLASSLDLMPTLLGISGISTPAGLPGIDLRDGQAVGARRSIFGECFTHNAVDLQRPASSLRWRWMVHGDWKLIVPAPWNEPEARVELYHVREDSFETNNLATVETARVASLQQALDAWWTPKP